MVLEERYICTKEHPWSKEKGDKATHPDAVFVSDNEYIDGYFVTYLCPNCRLLFKVEIAQ